MSINLSLFFSLFGQDDLCEFQECSKSLFWLRVNIMLGPEERKELLNIYISRTSVGRDKYQILTFISSLDQLLPNSGPSFIFFII